MRKTSFNSNKLTHIFIWVFLPFTGAYFLTTFFSQVNAMLAPYLFHDVQMTAAELGWTTAIYLLVFALAQVPLGTLLDHYGPRKVQSILFLIAAIGITVFALSETPMGLFIGRGLIGVGMSGGLMSGFKAMRSWLPKERIPLANASLMAAGTLGAVFSTVPVEIALQFMSWRTCFLWMVILILITSAWIFFVVPDPIVENHSGLTLKQQILESKKIYTSPYFWRIAPLIAFAFGSNMAIVGLWAGPWLSDVAQLEPAGIAMHLLAISVALIIGIALWGVIADRVTINFQQPITLVIGVGAVLYILVQMLFVLGVSPGSYYLWIAFGFMSRYTTLAYAAMSQHFHDRYAGRATTALNMLFFLTAFATQLGMGMIIDLWPKDAAGHYSIQGYHVAFAAMIALQVIGYVWFCVFRKKSIFHDGNPLLSV